MQLGGDIDMKHRPGATSMASENDGTVLRDIERIFNRGSVAGMAEGQPLRQYATRGDEAAFEALVTRPISGAWVYRGADRFGQPLHLPP
jgi:hypothetical protein